MSDGCGGDAEMMEGKDISRDLEYHIARADRNYLKDGIHRAVITTPGCYMVTTVERAEKTIGDTLYRTDRRPHEPAQMQCFAVYGGMK